MADELDRNRDTDDNEEEMGRSDEDIRDRVDEDDDFEDVDEDDSDEDNDDEADDLGA